MREVTAKEAKNRFGRLVQSAEQGPVRITRDGKPVGVMMSVQQFERLRGAAWERVAATMERLGEEASASGLTAALVDSLLADGDAARVVPGDHRGLRGPLPRASRSQVEGPAVP